MPGMGGGSSSASRGGTGSSPKTKYNGSNVELQELNRPLLTNAEEEDACSAPADNHIRPAKNFQAVVQLTYKITFLDVH